MEENLYIRMVTKIVCKCNSYSYFQQNIGLLHNM